MKKYGKKKAMAKPMNKTKKKSGYKSKKKY